MTENEAGERVAALEAAFTVHNEGQVIETVPTAITATDDYYATRLNVMMPAMERIFGALPTRPVLFPPEPEPPIPDRSVLDRVSEARRKKLIPPEWIVDHEIPILYRYGHMELLFHIPVTIHEVIWDDKKYIVPDFKRKTVFVFMGLPIDHMGRYTASTLHVVSPAKNLPHVSLNAACLGLASGPAAITNQYQYAELRNVIIRAMHQINLSSLFTPKSEWPKEIRQALPLGTRGEKSEERRSRFNVAIKKYFTQQEDHIWTSQGRTR